MGSFAVTQTLRLVSGSAMYASRSAAQRQSCIHEHKAYEAPPHVHFTAPAVGNARTLGPPLSRDAWAMSQFVVGADAKTTAGGGPPT